MRQIPDKYLGAMIAIKPLPGSPKYGGSVNEIVDMALKDLEQYKLNDVDVIVLENDNDVPYIKPPLAEETLLAIEEVSKAVRKKFNKPIGLQILEGASIESLHIAQKCDLDFIRVESYVFAHVGSAGIIEACAGKLLRERKKLNCEHIKVFADVKKKHCSHSLTSDLDITDEIKQAEFCLVDGIMVTGKFSGEKPNAEDLIKAKSVTKLPVMIGSGMDKENIKDFIKLADGFIVGTTFRVNSNFFGEIDPKRLKEFVEEFKKVRGK